MTLDIDTFLAGRWYHWNPALLPWHVVLVSLVSHVPLPMAFGLGRILAQPIWVWWAGPEDCPGKERESDFAEDGKDCNSDNIIWTTQNHNKSEYEIRIIHTSINIATYLDLMPHALNFYNCSVEWKDRSRNLEKMGGQKGRSPCVASERCRPECRLTTRPDGAFLKVSGKVMSSPLKERSSGESLECKIHQDSWPVSVGIEVIRA